MPAMPDPPPWIATLPRDRRGFPVPAEAGWDENGPLISFVATDRKVALGTRRGCAVCGYPMPTGHPVYRAFAQSDAAHLRLYEREHSVDLGGPLHLSCVLFSAMVCPYLRERNSRLGRDSGISPGARRGTRAAVMGFEDFALLLYAAPHRFLDPEVPSPHFAYLNLVDDIPYRDGEELGDRFFEAVTADAELIDMSAPRLYWQQGRDVDSLARLLRSDFSRLDRATPIYDQVIQGTGRFVAFPCK